MAIEWAVSIFGYNPPRRDKKDFLGTIIAKFNTTILTFATLADAYQERFDKRIRLCIAELKHLHHRDSREEKRCCRIDKEASQRVENIGDKSVYHFWSVNLVSLLVSFDNFRTLIIKYRKNLRMPRLLAGTKSLSSLRNSFIRLYVIFTFFYLYLFNAFRMVLFTTLTK